jgi:CRP/FNR family transcriptional regulator, cyclic AMP receptor protein
MDDPGQLWIGQVRKQGEPRDRVHQLLSTDHARMVPDPATPWKAFRVDGPISGSAAWVCRARNGGPVTPSLEHTTQLLSQTSLFAGIDADGLARIAGRMTELDVPADRVIARQGEIGTGFFVIVSGNVRVVRDGETLAELGPGDFFGELSVLDGKPRNAQVVTTEPTTCLALASWEFEAVVREQPSVALAILRELAGRLRDLTEMHRH